MSGPSRDSGRDSDDPFGSRVPPPAPPPGSGAPPPGARPSDAPPPGYAPPGYPAPSFPASYGAPGPAAPGSPAFGPAGYTPYGYTPGVRPTRTNGMAVASMVLGIIGLVLFCVWVPSVLAVIFGAVGLSQTKKDPTQGGRGMAVAGLVLGLIGVAVIVLVLAVGSFSYQFNSN